MKIVIIYPDIRRDFPDYTGNYSEGICYLSAVLKRAGYTVSLVHITKPVNEKELLSKVGESNPDIIGFSANTHMFCYVEMWASWIKRNIPNAIVIWGGAHPTMNPDSAISVIGIDGICIGEGEETLIELCKRKNAGEDVSNIESLWIKDKDGNVKKNPIRKLVKDINSLGFPDRDIFDFKNLISSRESIAHFSASRGCPYNCNYCSNEALRDLYPNKQSFVRIKGVDNIINEIKETIHIYSNIKYIAFNDDIFGINLDWLLKFIERYKKEINLPFICNCRPNLVKNELVELLIKGGCTCLYIGVESGDEEIRKNILGRGDITDFLLEKAFKICHDNELPIRTFNMVGLPDETMKDILKTIKLNARLSPLSVMVSIFYPYAGTKLSNICFEKGYIKSDICEFWEPNSILLQPSITRSETRFAFYFFKLFFKLYIICWKFPKTISNYIEKQLDMLWLLPTNKMPILTDVYIIIYRFIRIIYLRFIIHFYNRTSYLFLKKNNEK